MTIEGSSEARAEKGTETNSVGLTFSMNKKPIAV
jgi:hypothetical protein